jgi:hypothetical protein
MSGGPDNSKLFAAEREGLELHHYEDWLKDIEVKLLEKL